MGFLTSPACNCCNQPPCSCFCEGVLSPSVAIDLTKVATTEDCGICEWASGTYYLDPCTNPLGCGDPENPWTAGSDLSCRWSYTSSISPELICSTVGDGYEHPYKTVFYHAQAFVDARTYCAYQKDGIIYDHEITGAKLVGRAIEVRLRLILSPDYRIGSPCYFIRDPSQSQEEAVRLRCEQLADWTVIDPTLYMPTYMQCCVSPGTYEEYPLGNCDAFGAYNTSPQGTWADTLFLWRTINSMGHRCEAGTTEPLRFVPEGSYSWRLYGKDGGDCAKYDLCTAPGVVTWES